MEMEIGRKSFDKTDATDDNVDNDADDNRHHHHHGP